MNEANSPVCGNSDDPPTTNNFCSDDCGADVLDVLLLRTPEANAWLSNTWGIYAEWFLYAESHNINLAFNNSGIPNKRVRITIVNFTPDFSYSTNQFVDLGILADMNSLNFSLTANNLMNQYKADIVALLTKQ